LASSDAGVHLFTWRGCVFRVPDGVQPPKAGSLFFCRNLVVRPGEHVLEIGAGLGLAAVLAAKAGATVIATDILPKAVEVTRANASLNGVVVDARIGDCYAPVAGERFDLVCTNAPQMPTPANRARGDAAALADNGGVDGWEMLDRVIEGARRHLRADGRLVFTRPLGIKRNVVLLPKGWELVECASPAIVSTDSDGRVRVSFLNDRDDQLPVKITARRLP